MSEHTIPVLKKAMRVMRSIAQKRDETTAKALARSLGISSSTAYRILQTLTAEDWVRPTSGGRYELSFGLLPLLQPLARHELLIETAGPFLAKLARETGLASKFSVREADQAVALARAESPRETSVAVRIGSAFHLTLGSSGAVLMSELSSGEFGRLVAQAPKECWKHQTPADVTKRIAQCRRTGVCSDFGGYQPGVHAMSSPVRDRSNTIVGVITVIGFAGDFAGASGEDHARVLSITATACSGALAGASFSPAT